MQAYSIEFRREVLADCDAGMGTMAVAIKHRVSDSWVRRLKQRRRETGEITARPPIKKTPPKWHAYVDRLRGLVEKRPDITLRELRDALGVEVSLQTLSVALRTLKYTFKKSPQGSRARSAGHCRTQGGLACQAGGPRPATARFHRRDVGKNQSYAIVGPCNSRSARCGSCAAWPLENNHIFSGTTCYWINRAFGGRWSNQRRYVPQLC